MTFDCSPVECTSQKVTQKKNGHSIKYNFKGLLSQILNLPCLLLEGYAWKRKLILIVRGILDSYLQPQQDSEFSFSILFKNIENKHKWSCKWHNPLEKHISPSFQDDYMDLPIKSSKIKCSILVLHAKSYKRAVWLVSEGNLRCYFSHLKLFVVQTLISRSPALSTLSPLNYIRKNESIPFLWNSILPEVWLAPITATGFISVIL